MTRGWLLTRPDDSTGSTGLNARLVDLDSDDALGGSLLVDGAVGDVTVAVTHSSLNFKDALAFQGNRGVARISPLVPGIDVVGVVADSRHPRWRIGDRVVLNGAGAGETRHGGFAERAVLDGGTLVAVPSTLSNAQAAAIGTAGFTAMMAVLALEKHGIPDGDVLVTGASGGLGSYAVALLDASGRRVVAATGSTDHVDALRALGAADVIHRSELDRESKPLQSQRWAAAVDAVGGRSLATVLATTASNGAVVACGNAASAELPTTVMPFILRGVALLGANSTAAPLALREHAWGRLGADLDPAVVDGLTRWVDLDAVTEAAAELLDGGVRGRVGVTIE